MPVLNDCRWNEGGGCYAWRFSWLAERHKWCSYHAVRKTFANPDIRFTIKWPNLE